MTAHITHTRKSLAARIKEKLNVAGIAYEVVMVGGAIRYRIGDEDLTPGQAAERYGA